MRYKGFRITCDLQLDRNEAVTVYVLFMVEFRGFEWDANTANSPHNNWKTPFNAERPPAPSELFKR